MTDHLETEDAPEPFPPVPVDGAAVRPEDGDQSPPDDVDEDVEPDGGAHDQADEDVDGDRG